MRKGDNSSQMSFLRCHRAQGPPSVEDYSIRSRHKLPTCGTSTFSGPQNLSGILVTGSSKKVNRLPRHTHFRANLISLSNPESLLLNPSPLKVDMLQTEAGFSGARWLELSLRESRPRWRRLRKGNETAAPQHHIQRMEDTASCLVKPAMLCYSNICSSLHVVSRALTHSTHRYC